MTATRRASSTRGNAGAPSEPETLRAVKLVGGGVVLGHAGGATWMVRGGLPGELVRVRQTRRRARVVEAVAEAVVADPHPARLAEPCPHATRCGGCDWPHVDPAAGARLKAEVAAEAAGRHSALAEALRSAPVTPSPGRYRLRSRLHWDPVAGTLGFFGHRSRDVVAIPRCRIVTSALADRLDELGAALAGRCPQPVDLEWLEGDDGVVVALRPPPGGGAPPRSTWLPPPATLSGVVGCHRLSAAGEVVDGWGRDSVTMRLPVPLEVPVGSFFQGNRHLVPVLFERLVDLIGPGAEPVLDLHGGVGFIAAAATRAGRTALTIVEPHRPSADAARRNLPGAVVVAATAERFLADMAELSREVVVATDPPRTGMSDTLRGALARWRPHRVLSLGCDPATWSRDVGLLLEQGYRLAHLELVDLFPFTHHVEVLAVLESE